MHVRLAMVSLFVLSPLASGFAFAEAPIDLGDKRELFIDSHLIDNLQNAQLTLAKPHDEGIALNFDNPWEGLFCGYCTVIQDGDKYRVYYRGMPIAGGDGSREECTCVAVSDDGIHWTKPNLGIYEMNGTRDNNVVLTQAFPATHNFSPFLDPRPDVSADQRYKAVGGTSPKGLIGYVSADGLHWNKLQDEPIFNVTGWAFDSQNVCFWSQAEECYVLYFRKVPSKIRAIARTTSVDFMNWTEPEMMTYSDTGGPIPSHHLYTNQTSPYFRAPHIYVSTAARFLPGRRVISEKQAEEIGVHSNYFGDTSDAVMMTSRGGTLYDRTFGDGFVRPGIGLENWVSRTNYPALNIVQTGPTEMSLYVNQNYGQPTSHLRRYSLRLDGLASVHASANGGELVTKPLTFSGSRLMLNFATSAAGGIRVELQDAGGQPLPGYALEDSVETIGNEIERAVSWKDGDDVSKLAGKPVRIRFVLNDADLYALRFAE